jgi:hypothetical protein
MSQRDPFVLRFYIARIRSRRKPSILPRRCELSQQFSPFHQKFSVPIIISFTFIRVSAVLPPSSRCIFPFPLIPHVVVAPKRYGFTSCPISHGRKGHGYLLSISTDQAHKSRLEMFDRLILAPKIFTRNELQVKVTAPLQVPSTSISSIFRFHT